MESSNDEQNSNLKIILEFYNKSVTKKYESHYIESLKKTNLLVNYFVKKSNYIFLIMLVLSIVNFIPTIYNDHRIVWLFLFTLLIVKTIFLVILNQTGIIGVEESRIMEFHLILKISSLWSILLIIEIGFLIYFEDFKLSFQINLLILLLRMIFLYINDSFNVTIISSSLLLYYELSTLEILKDKYQFIYILIYFKVIINILLNSISYYKTSFSKTKFKNNSLKLNKEILLNAFYHINSPAVFVNSENQIIFQNKHYLSLCLKSFAESEKNGEYDLIEKIINKCEDRVINPNLPMEIQTTLNDLFSKRIADPDFPLFPAFLEEIYPYHKFFNEEIIYLFKTSMNDGNTYSLFLKIQEQMKIFEFYIEDITPIINLEKMDEFMKNSNSRALYLAKAAHELKNPIFAIQFLANELEKKVNVFRQEDDLSSIISSSSNSSFEEFSNSGQMKNSKSTNSILHKGKQIKVLGNYIISLIEELNMVVRKSTENHNQLSNSDEDSATDLKAVAKFCMDIIKTRKRNENNENKKNIRLKIEFDERIGRKIKIQERIIKQILINLLSNAYKFTISGKIILKIKKNEFDKIVFTVEDTGLGIPLEKQSSLFKPFNIIKENEKFNDHGSGLGLLIVKGMVEDLGSKLEFKSMPSIGTTFWFEVDLKTHFERTMSREQTIILEIGKSLIFDHNLLKNAKKKRDSLELLRDELDVDHNNLELQKSSDFLIDTALNMRKKSSPFNPLLTISRMSDKSIGKGFKSKDSNKQIEFKLDNSSISNVPVYANPQTRKLKPPMSRFSSRNNVGNLKDVNELISLRVMICDDQKEMQMQMKELIKKVEKESLKEKGFSVSIVETSNAFECLYKIYSDFKFGNHYDVLLIDENMPFMKGSTCVSIIRNLSNEELRNSILMFSVSGEESPEIREFLLDKGCKDVYPKPLKKSIITHILNEVIKFKNGDN